MFKKKKKSNTYTSFITERLIKRCIKMSLQRKKTAYLFSTFSYFENQKHILSPALTLNKSLYIVTACR